MHSLEISPELAKRLAKLARKYPKRLVMVNKKFFEIAVDPDRFKNLSGPLKGHRRIHIDDSFVLTFSVDDTNKRVILKDLSHHDDAYLI